MSANSVDKEEWQDCSWAIGCHAEYIVQMTPQSDRSKVHLYVPPGKVIPIVFLPGIMGSNLRMSKARQKELNKTDNRSWRPDDKGFVIGGIFDKPKERQLRLDPDETEVDRYQVTTDGDCFDATGNETQSSDARHDNVPDSLGDVGLLKSDPPSKDVTDSPNRFTAAQKARARGWSEVMFGSYGDILKFLEKQLNSILIRKHGSHERSVAKSWVHGEHWYSWLPGMGSDPGEVIGEPAEKLGNASAPALTAEEVKKIADCWYPVHAMGYNWLKSNGDAAKELAPMIRQLIETYRNNGRDCPGVIIVTHSMGGLLGRALIHSDYGNIKDSVLGLVHGAMPTMGAAAAYKRLRAGFEGGPFSIIKRVLGPDGPSVTAVLANAQGGLELLPNSAYGTGWLKVQGTLKDAMVLPEADASTEIYLSNQWWRLINPEWIDPAEQGANPTGPDGGKIKKQVGIAATFKKVINAQKFSNAINETFARQTYASFGEDWDQKAWGEVVWRVTSGDLRGAGDPKTWQLVEQKPDGVVIVASQNGQRLTLEMHDPSAAGDGTVPAVRSAAKVKALITFTQIGYEHQGSYQADVVKDATLYGVVKIAAAYDATWWAKKV